MNFLDLYYRAFNELRKSTKENSLSRSFRNDVKKADVANDNFEIVRRVCKVEEDWVNEIDKGLVFVEKAILEERQFIRSNGEVVPIEKTKKVSKDSVVHLARHSNLITRVVEDQDIVPDKLYTVEKLSDYSVYENRFLYLCLCYLRDFISLRYNKILEATNTYNGHLTLNKTIFTKNQKIVYKVDYLEEKKNDEIMKKYNDSREIIGKIDLLLRNVIRLLNTNLMQEVSKVAMIKPPITKTNVLKMNQNFKNALALYDFVASYPRAGYEITEERKVITPFSDDVSDELAEIIALTSFLTYEHGNSLSKELRKEFEAEEDRLKEEEAKKFEEQLKHTKRKMNDSNLSVEEYVLMVEKRNKLLEKDSLDLIKAKGKIEDLSVEITNLNEEKEKLSGIIDDLNYELEQIEIRHAKEIEELNAKHEVEINELNEAHAKEVSDIKEAHRVEVEALNTEIDRLNQKYIDDMNALKEAHALEIATLKEEHQAYINDLNERHENEINELKTSYENQIVELKASYETRISELNEAHANEILNLTNSYESKINEINEAHAAEVSKLSNELAESSKKHIEEISLLKKTQVTELMNMAEKHQTEIDDLVNKHNSTLANLTSENERNITSLNSDHDNVVKDYKSQIVKLNMDLAERNDTILEAQENIDKLTEDKLALNAELNALRTKLGLNKLEDYTTKDRFDELEKEFNYFIKLFNEQKKKLKRRILKEMIEQEGYKKEKKPKKKKEEE